MFGITFASFVVPMPRADRLTDFWGTLRVPRRRSSSEIADMATLEAGEWEEGKIQPEKRGRRRNSSLYDVPLISDTKETA